MEIVALHARLREDFSALLKPLPSPHAVSMCAVLPSTVSCASFRSSTAPSDLYTQHCQVMLWRLNSYQYGSVSAFLMDLAQLERVTESPVLKQRVKNLCDRLAVAEVEKPGDASAVKACNQGGTTVSLGSSSGVRGLQQVTSIGSEENDSEANTMWLCNLTMSHQIVTIGTFQTQDEALQGYEEQRKVMAENKAAGFHQLKLWAAKVEERQRREDMRALKEAVAQCRPRLTTMKGAPVTAPIAAPHVNTMTLMTRGTPRVVAKCIAADAAASSSSSSSSPKTNSGPTETGAVPRRVPTASKRPRVENVICAASSKKQKVGSAGNSVASSSSVGGRSYLKLRRLIQKRLCRHLKGREVCVLSNPDNLDGRLQASGRLEAGKVFSFRRKKQMTFADYVCDELGRAESACAHMFLVRSKESIDDHLKICDAILDKELEPTSSHPQHAGSKKASRRTH